MTKITIKKDEKEGYMSITADGHHKDPTVCSAISAIMQTTEAGLELLANSVNNVTINVIEDCLNLEDM